jgi:hypothetical protein
MSKSSECTTDSQTIRPLLINLMNENNATINVNEYLDCTTKTMGSSQDSHKTMGSESCPMMKKGDYFTSNPDDNIFRESCNQTA